MEAVWSQLELTRPAWMAALLVLPLVIRYSRRSLARFSPFRQAVSLGCRLVVVIAVVLALSGIRVVEPSRQQCVVFAVDRSASIADSSPQTAEEFLVEALDRAGRNRVVYLPFAAQPGAAVDRRPEGPSELDTEGTNLAAAIEVACAVIPPDYLPHVVLLTDGNETDGEAIEAARAASVPISTVPLDSRAVPEVYVSAVETKSQVQEGEPFYVDVLLHSSHDDEGTVRLFRGDRLVEERPARVTKGENRFRISQSITGERLATFTARIEGFQDTIPENNTAAGVVFTTARPRVMLVESEPLLGRHLTAALKSEEIDVEVRSPDRIPESLADLQNYELLVLSNVPAASLSTEQMELMRGYVRDFGGGLIVIGGDQAFTPGGYRNTVLEQILPVNCEFEEKEEKPGLAMVLVIDRSGSMEGDAIELAKEATRRAVEMLDPKDQVGVIAFEDASRWVPAIHPYSDKTRVLQQIDTITAGGGTDLLPAMEKAYLALDEAFAELKHMIVLTDGVSHPGDFEALVTRIASSGITVSTVAVGEETVPALLQDIARIGKGHYYYCDDPADVPSIFVLETASASKMGINEQPFFAQVARSLPALSELDFQAAPSLLGYVETQPKPTSQLVMTSESGDPLLVWWRYGLGVTVAFTSDVQSRWATAWLQWPGFGRFWSQLVRHAMRQDEAEDFVLRVDHRKHLALVTLDAVDPQGQYLNGADVRIALIDPAGGSRNIEVRQVAPGRYAAELATPEPGMYYLELSLRHQGRLVYVQRRGIAAGYADEFRTRPADRELLRSIAERTGGTYNPEPAAVFAPPNRTVPRTMLLWPYFVTLASGVFVLDVVLRRMRGTRSARP